MNSSKLLSLSLLLVTLAAISNDVFAMRKKPNSGGRRKVRPNSHRRPSRTRSTRRKSNMRNIRAVAEGAEGNVIKVFDANAPQNAKLYYGHSKRIDQIVFNRDKTRMAACANEDEKIIIWDSSDTDYHKWRQLKTIVGHTISMAFSPCGKYLVYGSGDGTDEGPIVILDISNPDPKKWYELKKIRVNREYIGDYRLGDLGFGYIYSLMFNHDGTKLAFALPKNVPHDYTPGVVQVLDTSSWKLLRTLRPSCIDRDGDPRSYPVKFSNDGRKLVVEVIGDPSYTETWNISSRNPKNWTSDCERFKE